MEIVDADPRGPHATGGEQSMIVDEYHNLVRSEIYPLLPAHAGRLLDLGGGVGATSNALKKAGRASHITVADRVADNVLEGVDQAFACNIDDEASLLAVLTEAGPFSTILALDILEHLRDPWRVVDLLSSALVPSGTIVASIPNVNYHGLLLPLILRGRYDLTDSGILDRTHLRWFARHGAVDLMSSSGLRVEEVVPAVYGRKAKLVTQVSFGKLTRFTAMQYLIRARRVTH